MIRLFIFLAFLLIIDTYSFQAIKTVSKKKVRLTYILVNGILYFLLFFQIFFIENVRESALLTYNFTLLFILFVSKTILILFLFPEDILRVIKFLFSKIQNKKIDNSRRKFISNLSLAVAAIPIPIMIHGITRGRYNFKVVNHEISFKDLPKSFDGYTITHLSDFHCGSFESRSKLKYAIDLVNEQNSDLIAFTGDFVNNTYTEILPWIDELKKINSKDGKFSILGNHDYGDYYDWGNEENKKLGFKKLIEIQNELGFKVLRDESVHIKKNNEKISLVGVENWGDGFKKKGDIDKAISYLDESDFKIVLSHDPSHWDKILVDHKEKFNLTLSGHTHGMQFGIEIPGFIKWSPVKYRYKYWAGLYERSNQFINVNRGFGVLGFPGRVGIWPEITVIKLKKA
jgi:predicted MPP superfamily phosphohydrolase/phosphate starvation-inducible membrane PsiE